MLINESKQNFQNEKKTNKKTKKKHQTTTTNALKQYCILIKTRVLLYFTEINPVIRV
jgi:hypothetical protein